MYCVMLAQSNELKIEFTADRNVLQSHPPNAFNITRLVYNDTTIIKSIRKLRSKVFLAIRLLLSDD